MTNNKNIRKADYISYMHLLKGSVFKILPLYEEEVSTIGAHINSVIFEIYNVREISSEYDGAWLTQTHAILNGLLDECNIKDNKAVVKNKVFGIIDTIEKQIKKIEQD